MIDAATLRELEDKLKSLKEKKAQLDNEKMRHEVEIRNAKESLEVSLNELKGLGFTDLETAKTFISESCATMDKLLKEAEDKIEGIVTEQ